MTTSALLLVDIQNDYFPAGRHPVTGIETAAGNAARLLAAARASGRMVIHIRHEITRESAPFFAPGSSGADIHAKVAPLTNETVILKHHPNSFRDTGLNDLLRGAGITELTICGAMSQMCIDSTARAGADLGYEVTVIHDACAATALRFGATDIPATQVHAAFMAALSGLFAHVRSTQQEIGVTDM